MKFRAHNKTINVGREVNLGLFVGALLRPYTQPATAVVILYFGSFMCGDDKEERRRRAGKCRCLPWHVVALADILATAHDRLWLLWKV